MILPEQGFIDYYAELWIMAIANKQEKEMEYQMRRHLPSGSFDKIKERANELLEPYRRRDAKTTEQNP